MYRTEAGYFNEMRRGTEKVVQDHTNNPEFNITRPYAFDNYESVFYAEIPPHGFDSFWQNYDMMLRVGGVDPDSDDIERLQALEPYFVQPEGQAQLIEIKCDDSEAVIYYSKNNLKVWSKAAMIKYVSPIMIRDLTTIYAKAFR